MQQADIECTRVYIIKYCSEGVTPKVNIVDTAPSVESQRRNHVIVTPEQTFHIMADLSAKDKYVSSILDGSIVVMIVFGFSVNRFLAY